MSKRLYFLLPDVESTRALTGELVTTGIDQEQIHILANHFTPLDGLPEASFLQKSDFKTGVEIGVGAGGVAGLIGGLLAVSFPPAGLVLGGGAILAMSLAGAGAGALVSGLVAQDIPNHELEAFEGAIEEGQLLMIVDVPKVRLDEMLALIRDHHPEVTIATTEPNPRQL